MIIFLIHLSILCKSLPWFKNNLSNLSFIRLSCLNIFFSILLIGNNKKNIVLNLLKTIKFILFCLSFIFLIFKFNKFVFFILNFNNYYNSLEFYLFFVSFVFSILTFLFIFNLFNLKNNNNIKKLIINFYGSLILFCPFLIYFFNDLFLYDYELKLYSNYGENGIENLNTNSQINESKNNELGSVSTTNEADVDKYVVKVDKNLADKVIKTTTEAAKILVQENAPSLGAAGAAGAAASAAIKATSGIPIAQRAGIVAGSAFITAVSTQAGLSVGAAITRNLKLKTDNEKSKLPVDNPPSPDDTFINSVLENSENNSLSPLEELLSWQFVSIALIFLIILFLFYIYLTRYLVKYNFILISNLIDIIDKYLFNNSTRAKDWYKNKLNKSIVYNTRFMIIMMIFNILILIYLLFLNLYISVELMNNIDDYVTVYNNIHGKK